MSNGSIAAFLRTIPGMNGPGNLVFLFTLMLVPTDYVELIKRMASHRREPPGLERNQS